MFLTSDDDKNWNIRIQDMEMWSKGGNREVWWEDEKMYQQASPVEMRAWEIEKMVSPPNKNQWINKVLRY